MNTISRLLRKRGKFKIPDGFTRFFGDCENVHYMTMERTLVVSRKPHYAIVESLPVVWEKSEQEGFYEFAIPEGKCFVVCGKFEAFEKPLTDFKKKLIRQVKPRVRSFNSYIECAEYRTFFKILRW